ncbi:hypothetical protein VST7929_00958 [Vibrio stylophorae]|uniref:Outer membrane protein beta-barrel domain-containing protein n=1 Tax=Vibrio stylophorae TaxID=659351 RepID=A0ABN8DQU7_9VIBR|nr:outer membrane beta-barrel protein [Vibrio stylophorae]CAH0533105.1 hypothetical protein VST7929_00958 [Vibrio stylophorae]
MKKQITIASLLAASMMAAPAMAANMDWVVGGGIGYQNDDVSGQFEQNGEDVAYQLRGGMILNDHHRFLATYNYMDKSEQNMFLASYDYLYPVFDQVSLFAGVNMGVSDSEIHNESSTDFVWGGQVGATYAITDSWSTDLTYRYIAQDYDEQNTEIDNSQQVMLTVDYRF